MKFDNPDNEPALPTNPSELPITPSPVSPSQAASFPLQDRYLHILAIITLVGAVLMLLLGLYNLFLYGQDLMLFITLGIGLPQDQYTLHTFLVNMLTQIIVVVAGGFTLYQSIRSLKHQVSARFTFLPFRVLAIAYVILLVLRLMLWQFDAQMSNSSDASIVLLNLLLADFEGFLACLVLIALCLCQLSSSSTVPNWRRMITAFVCGTALTQVVIPFSIGMREIASITFPSTCEVDYLSSTCFTNIAVWTHFILPSLIEVVLVVVLAPSVLALILRKVPTQTEALLLGLSYGAGLILSEHLLGFYPVVIPFVPFALVSSTASSILDISGSAFAMCSGVALVTVGWHALLHKHPHALSKALLSWLGLVIAIWLFTVGEQDNLTLIYPAISALMLAILLTSLLLQPSFQMKKEMVQ